jgi:hypothetical protein
MSVSRFRPVAVLLLCAHLGGCSTWQPVQISPREFIEAEDPYKIRLRDPAGDWLDVSYPRVVGDTIAGTTRARRPSDGTIGSIQVRIAITDALRIEAQRLNTPQTIIAAVAVTSVILGAVLCATGVACGRRQVNPGQ